MLFTTSTSKKDTFIFFLIGQRVSIFKICCGYVVQFKVFFFFLTVSSTDILKSFEFLRLSVCMWLYFISPIQALLEIILMVCVRVLPF
jgi:hypothetical protein